MRINRGVWMELTEGERIACIRYAVSENRKKWKNRRGGRSFGGKLIKLIASNLP